MTIVSRRRFITLGVMAAGGHCLLDPLSLWAEPDPKKPPYERLLKGDDAKTAAELQKKMDDYYGSAFYMTIMGEVLGRYENQVRINKDVVDAWGIPVLDIQTKYTDNDADTDIHLIDNWGLTHTLFGNSGVIDCPAKGWEFVDGYTLADL